MSPASALLRPILLMGAPNSGKTTLYNWLTASKFKTVNYPGATVEVSEGLTSPQWGEPLLVCDTPGTYSLFPKSYDEKVAVDSLYAFPGRGPARMVIAVVDATQMARHLYLVAQLLKVQVPVVIALTNIDLLPGRQLSVDSSLLSQRLNCPVVPINGQSGKGVAELTQILHQELKKEIPAGAPKTISAWSREDCEASFQNLNVLVKSVLIPLEKNQSHRSDSVERTRRLDGVLLHPILGLFIFLLFMSALFTSIFWAASPLMDGIDAGFSILANWVSGSLGEGLMTDFLSNAVIAGVGAVLVFVPQIFILSIGISYFEDSGYLARAATLIDRPLSKLGLNGRSFVPLLSGYACAIPAMMAARTISSRKERFITLFIIPLMSCSARLPVYTLLLAFLFRGQPAWIAGLFLTGLYVLSLVIGAVAAAIANRMLKTSDPSFFILELPLYRRPYFRAVLKSASTRVLSYVTKAGPIIFFLSVLIWGACTFPHYELTDPSERLSSSYAAEAGKFLEPVMQPMGADWRVGVGLIAAFAAREVFVASLAVVFHIADDEGDEERLQASLLDKMAEAKTAQGDPLFTVASVWALILFFMIALQCMATFGIARREFGSWTLAILQLVVFNGAAYLCAVAVFQILS